jgi:hypothetical protein
MITKLLIDKCRVVLSDQTEVFGCVEAYYPSDKWILVDVFNNCYTAPDSSMIDKSMRNDATILAYGGDGVWFSYKEKPCAG